MALELQIKTGQAAQQLKLITENLNQLKAALGNFPAATKLNNTIQAVNGLRPIDPATTRSINQLSNAIKGLSDVGQLKNVASGLNSLGKIDMGRVAANVQKLSNAMATLRVPPNLAAAAAAMEKFSAATMKASASARQFGTAVKGIKAPAGLARGVNSLNKFGASAHAAAGGAHVFGRALGSTNQLLAGFGVTLGTIGFGRFISGLSDAERQVASFNSITNHIMKDAGGADQAMGMLTDTAFSLGLPLRELVDTYPKFAASLRSSGQSAAETNQIYKDMSVALAGVGADAIKTQRVFKAVEQMFNKGSVTAEELKQQLGDAIPGAVALFAKSMGKGREEFLKMMEQGQIASSNIKGFATILKDTFGPAAEAMAKTWVGAANNMGNAWYKLQTAMSGAFFDQLIGPVNNLTEALMGFVNSGAAEAWGVALGKIAAFAVDAATAIVQLANGEWGGLLSNMSGVAGAAVALAAAFKVVQVAIGLFSAPIGMLINGIGGVSLGLATLTPGIGYLVLSLAAAAGAVYALVQAYQSWGASTETAAQAAEKLYQASSQITGEVDTLGEAFYTSQHATDQFGISLTMLDSAMAQFGGEVGQIQSEIAALNQKLKDGEISAKDHAKAMEELSARMEKVQEAMTKTARAAEDYRNKVDDAGSSSSSAGSKASSASSGFRSMSTGMTQASSAARALDAALSSLASTQRQVDTSTTSVTLTGESRSSGGTVGDHGGPIGFEGSMWSGGGISHKRSPRRFHGMSPSVWDGARSFAGGGLSDSTAIPAILHPNEAVVPLTGGGEIPVASSGPQQQTSTSVTADTQYLVKLVELGIGQKTEMGRIWQGQNTLTTIVKHHMEGQGTLLMNIQNLLTQGVAQLASLAAKLTTGGFGGGGGTGSFASGTSGSMGTLSGLSGGGDAEQLANQLYDFYKQQKDIKNQLNDLYQFGQWFSYGTGTGTANAVLMNPGDRQREEELKRQMTQLNQDMQRMLNMNGSTADQAYQLLAQQMNTTESAIADAFRPGGAQMQAPSMSFAIGSPNASKDASGGFQALLHPDEAVIPLPDGRSVPVSLPDRLMDAFYKGQKQGTSTTYNSHGMTQSSSARENKGGNAFNIVINVNATDAASFSRSQDQIMQELRMKLERVGEKFGANQRTEDPTRRPK